jgi:hypothetical protein
MREWPISRAVSISGAVIDSTGQDKAQLTLGYLDFGYEILEPFTAAEHGKGYFVLMDGGNIDNLGLVPLVKRRCENITVVDSAEDQLFKFEDYGIFKNINAKELEVAIEIPEIEETSSFENSSSCATNPPNVPDVRYSCDKAVRKGTLQYCAKAQYCPTSSVDKNVTYVKLSANRKLLEGARTDDNIKKKALKAYGERVVKFYAGHHDEPFPQYYTFGFLGSSRVWPEDRFLAVVDLGYCNVMRHYHPEEPCHPK